MHLQHSALLGRIRWPHITVLAALALAGGLMATPASAAASGTWTLTASMNALRVDDTATVLPDGEVLVAGGDSTGTSAELYNPATGTWTLTGSLITPTYSATATLLTDGDVLVAGGGGTTTDTAELYNPATGTWALTGNLHTNREDQTATLLNNGEVLVAGGFSENAPFTELSSAELYNPATGTWTPTGSLSTAVFDATATLLENGKVLVAGGVTTTGSAVTAAELYNPATGKWTPTGSMNAARAGGNATLLPNGDVLATSGFGIGTENGGPFAELYTPATGQWSPAINGLPSLYGCSGVLACFGSSATLLGDGDVLVAGGDAGLASNSHSSSEAVLYNPTANSWTTTGSLNVSRLFQTASLLQNGQVLVAGGESFAKHAPTGVVSAELYTP
jgi:hypothetical protein